MDLSMADYASAKYEKGLPKGNPFLLWVPPAHPCFNLSRH